MVPEFCVSNFETSLAFYTELLGFSVRYERSNPRFAYLEQEGVQLMLEELTEDSWIAGPTEYPFGRGMNLQIELADIEPAHQRLRDKRIALFEELDEAWFRLGDRESGQKEFLVQDPDGYLLRFCQHLGER